MAPLRWLLVLQADVSDSLTTPGYRLCLCELDEAPPAAAYWVATVEELYDAILARVDKQLSGAKLPSSDDNHR